MENQSIQTCPGTPSKLDRFKRRSDRWVRCPHLTEYTLNGWKPDGGRGIPLVHHHLVDKEGNVLR